MSSTFRYQPFVTVSGSIGGKVPRIDIVLSSNEQENSPITSLHENCIKFESQTDRNYSVELRQTYLALKLKFVKDRGYGAYNGKEVKKDHKEETEANEEMPAAEEVKKAPAPFVGYVKYILHSIFPLLNCMSTIDEFTTLLEYGRTSLTFPATFRGASLNIREFCTARGTNMRNFRATLWKRLCLSFFFTSTVKMLS